MTPNPRNTANDTVDVTFSKPIDPATFDASALTLTRNGTAIAIDSRVSVVELTPTTFQIAGLGTLTNSEGDYALSVDGGRHGFLVDRAEPSALAGAILCALSDAERLERMAAAAQRYVLATHGWDRVAERILFS